jgi:hypothetical protein
MGLDTSHDCWHGAYSAFTRWRHAVAIAAGYQVVPPTDEERATGRVLFDYVDIDWSIYTDENYQGEWDNGPYIYDPLLHLIVHSDCDGVIHPKHARPLAARLEGLLDKLDESQSGGHIWSMREVTQRFIDGLRKAADADEDVDFH